MTRLPFELLFALRYLRPRRTFVSIITLISIIGVVLGVAVLIVVISVMTGFDLQLRDRIIGFESHLIVRKLGGPMQNYQQVAKFIRDQPKVTGASPFIEGPIVIETQRGERYSQIAAPFLRGIDSETNNQVSDLEKSVVTGDFESIDGNGLLIGSALANRLSLSIGDPVAVYSMSLLREVRDVLKKDPAEQTTAPLADDYVIEGIFDIGYYEYNANGMVCSLFNAQDLFSLGNEANGIHVMLDDPEAATEMRKTLLAQLGPDFVVSTWLDRNKDIFNALVVEKNMIRFLLFFIVLVAAFGITSSMITFVVQKTREIGMLKALGASSRQVVWVFMSQSVFVGLLGVSIGLALGLFAIEYRNEFLIFMNQTMEFSLFPASIYGFEELPAIVDPKDLWIICGGSLIFCVLAGVFPAFNAGRLQPVEALRHD
ncbi:MAG: FtsX-like permease family protein [Verrucomicrobia bacterium]|jgi:lipoprotein-releasing system permease protein|nr:FtsX-like permease family protein [Verrucomicrobiota bacterium]MBT4273741.1 FtsX-like permease family protein [Verrucomicrobiota bacterium]MBT5062932.1 FtsX-like permease family protein [Verrucomicrobiota bacterium]MBT5480180.1 FtsX-like permease family protein [Verrucomicrobiota bacterium]MBT6236908.1 FtsX-like permease family protein [Verrucomicrobiota bacterium]